MYLLSWQYPAAGLVSGLGGVSIGTVLGFSAVLLPQLEDEGHLEEGGSKASWIGETTVSIRMSITFGRTAQTLPAASLSNVGLVAACPVVGVLATRLGRRGALMFLCVPSCAGWAAVLLSGGSSEALLYAGRLLQGAGVFSSAMQVYIVEIADSGSRGLLGSLGAVAVSTGIVLVRTYIVQAFF